MSRDLSADEKMNSVDGQVRDMLKNGGSILRCPFGCKDREDGGRRKTKQGERFCCGAMASAVSAVMDRVTLEDTVKAVYKASQN